MVKVLNTIIKILVALILILIVVVLVITLQHRSVEEIKFPLIGGHIRFGGEKHEPERLIELNTNESKLIFNDLFIIKMRNIDTTMNSVYLEFSYAYDSKGIKTGDSYDMGYYQVGDCMKIKISEIWYIIRILKIDMVEKKTFLYYYTSNREPK